MSRAPLRTLRCFAGKSLWVHCSARCASESSRQGPTELRHCSPRVEALRFALGLTQSSRPIKKARNRT